MKNPKIIISTVLFIILIIMPVALNKFYNLELSPVDPNNQSEKIFIVKPGEPFIQIADNLKNQGLIKSTLAFRLVVAQMGIAKSIQAGDFRLSSKMSARDIARELTHGAIDVWITIPEGLRIEEQADKIAGKLQFGSNTNYQFDKKEYTKIAREGYMFPDTYLLPKDSTAKNIADRLETTFSQKVDESLLKKGAKNNLSQDEVVILASLIEKEAKTDEEKPIIAGIILNRLKLGIALQIDATVSYAKGFNSASGKWWSEPTVEDYSSVRSPFNTYLAPGLPPAPISNPGLESIKAAAEPAGTDYLYYLHDSDGKIHYAKTVQEHNQNIKKYL